jgi:hypothetical protein
MPLMTQVVQIDPGPVPIFTVRHTKSRDRRFPVDRRKRKAPIATKAQTSPAANPTTKLSMRYC